MNDIIESLLKHHGFDANTHPFLVEEPETPPAKRNIKVKRVSINEDNENDDPNDNSINNEDANVEMEAGTCSV